MMTLRGLIEEIQDVIEALNNGGTPSVKLFNKVWIGMPTKIPMTFKNIAVIEVANEPNQYYTTCNAFQQYDVDVYITILSRGTVEDATLNVYDLTQAVKKAFKDSPKFDGNCMDSTVEDVIYGDAASDGANLVAASRVTLRCKMEG